MPSIERLVAALRPFAEAARRINHYDGERYNGSLFAIEAGGPLHELLDGIDGEPLTVDHLRAAYEALRDD